MRPRSVTGAKTALLVPITTRASPDLIFFHSVHLSDALRPECSTAILFPKYLEKNAIICGVREISGTSSTAHFPERKLSIIRCR